MSLHSVGTTTPTTNEEFAVHALVIHGAFFERKCQDIISQTKDWKIRGVNYPVEYQGKASNLDIWAEKQQAAARLSFPIECKKNNPEFVDWVFFPRRDHSAIDLFVRGVEIKSKVGRSGNWAISPLRRRIKYDLVVADEARETKGNYLSIKNNNDRTKTSNTAITDAATQIAIATQSLLQQEQVIVQKLSSAIYSSQGDGFSPYSSLFFFPSIVTTANLYTCEFQGKDIDLETGEIPWDKAKLIKQPYLLFNYALPVALQSEAVLTRITYESYWEAAQIAARMPIFVVQSKALPQFLDRVAIPKSHSISDMYALPTEVWCELHLHPESVIF